MKLSNHLIKAIGALASLAIVARITAGSLTLHDPALSFQSPPTPPTTGGAVFYVDINGNDLNDGLSPQAAWQHPHFAGTNAVISNALRTGGVNVVLTSSEVFPETNFVVGGKFLGTSTNAVTWSTTSATAAIVSNCLNSNPHEFAGPGSGFVLMITNGAPQMNFSNLLFLNSNGVFGVSSSGAGPVDVVIEQSNGFVGGITFSNCGLGPSYWQGFGMFATQPTNFLVTNISFNNCYFYSNGGYGSVGSFGTGLDSSYGIANVFFTNCVISNVPGNNYEYANGIFCVNISNLVVTQCTVHDLGQCSATNLPGGGVGIGWQLAVKALVSKNEVYNITNTAVSDGDGINPDYDTYDSLIEYNYVHNCQGAGIFENGSYGSNCFRFNICISNGLQMHDTYQHPMEFQIFHSVGSVSPTNILIYNNDFIAAAPGVEAFDSAQGLAGISGPAVVANNVFYAANASVAANYGPLAWNNWNNDYSWKNGGGQVNFAVEWNGTTYSTIKAWQNATGQDATALTNSPGWLNGVVAPTFYPGSLTAATNWTLQSSSALVHSAANLNTKFGLDNGGADFLSNSVPASGYAIGAVDQSQ